MNFPDENQYPLPRSKSLSNIDEMLGDRICDSVLAGFEETSRMRARIFTNFLAAFLSFHENLSAKLALRVTLASRCPQREKPAFDDRIKNT
jgi:hypothetical protein